MRRSATAICVLVALLVSLGSPASALGPQPAGPGDPSPSPSLTPTSGPSGATAPDPSASAPAQTTAPAATPAAPSPAGPSPTSPSPGGSTDAPASGEPQTTPSTPPAPSLQAAPAASPGPDAIAAKYADLGGAAGPLGKAAGDAACTSDGGCLQIFAGGRIYWTQATGAWAVTGRALAAYLAAGEPAAGRAGYPIADTQELDATSEWQAFQKADLFAGDATGAWFTRAQIGAKHKALGGAASRLGMPTGAQVCGLRDGGCYQHFEGGAIVWSPATGARVSWGAIRGAWAAQGFEGGRLGYPTTDEVCGLRDGGCYQHYQGGAIIWSPGTGPHVSWGAIRGTWAAHGFEGGRLGYPTTDEVCGLRDGGCYQHYQGGAIIWSLGSGARISVGAIRGLWAAENFENGWLRYPVTDEICSTTACVQKFQGGVISWRPGSVRTHVYSECEALHDSRSVYPSHGASSVTFAVAEDYGRSDAWIIRCMNVAGVYATDWAVRGTVGASGFKPPGVPSGPTRHLYSPTGSYSVTEAFGLGNPGTALHYITLNPNSRWGGNPWTPTYNKYFESPGWVGWDENMWYFATRPQHDYRQGAVINYNKPPDSEIVQDAGFAIFLHMNTAPTAGCVAIPDWHMVDWLQKAAPGDRFIMGVRSALFR